MGAIIEAHSFLVKLGATSGYSIVFMIVQLRVYQASSLLIHLVLRLFDHFFA
jgi:hypothetical protein